MDCKHHALSLSQLDIFLDQQKHPQSPIYNIGGYVELMSQIDMALFERAFDVAATRHDAFYLRFDSHDGKPYQYLQTVGPKLLLHDFTAHTHPREDALALIKKTYASPFKLIVESPQRAGLVKLSDTCYWFYTVSHHLAMDGWGYSLWIKNLINQYMRMAGIEGAEPEPEVFSFIDSVESRSDYVNSKQYQRSLAYWLAELQQMPSLVFEAKEPILCQQVAQCSHRETRAISQSKYAQWQALAKSHGGQVHHLFLALLYCYFNRVTSENVLAFGMPSHNRSSADKQVVGSYVSVSPMRFEKAPCDTLCGLIQNIKGTMAKSARHLRFPIHKAIEESNKAIPARLFDIQFNYQLLDYVVGNEDCATESYFLTSNSERVPFTFTICEYGEHQDTQIQTDTNNAYFDTQEGALHLDRMLFMLEQLAENPELPLSELEIVTPAEQSQLIAWAGQSQAQTQRIETRFAATAVQFADAVAIEQSEQSITYRELNQQANQIAHALLECAPQAQVIGISSQRSIEMIAIVLGILKAGKAYMPIDASYPIERQEQMLEVSECPLLLTDSASLMASELVCERIDIGSQQWCSLIASQPTNNVDVEINHELAYLMFTSGSTGKPKGVMIPHQGITRLVIDSNFMAIDSSLCMLQLSNVSFDVATLEIWAPLLNGGKLVLYPQADLSFTRLHDTIITHQVNSMWLTSALFDRWVHDIEIVPSCLTQVLAGGDVVSAESVKSLFAKAPSVRFINGYGPTENTTFSTCHSVYGTDLIGSRLPIGKPIDNSLCFILDENQQMLPLGCVGELCVAGEGLALGYLNNEEATNDKFIDVLIGGQTQRVYRTGDMAHWHMDGTLAYMGRQDQQVKIRGFRIELSEIAASLTGHEYVSECAVVCSEDKQIIAAIRLSNATISQEGLDAQLKDYLSAQLPHFMLPNRIVVLESLPVTSNGKLDRKAILQQIGKDHSKVHVAPRNQLEQHLHDIWVTLLNGPIGIQDSFFELGGHSLIAMQLVAKISQELGVELSLDCIFRHHTIESLAKVIETQVSSNEVTLDSFEGLQASGVLSLAQQQIWQDQQLNGVNAKYNIPGAFHIKGPLNVEALEDALQCLVQRHQILRTNYKTEADEVVQFAQLQFDNILNKHDFSDIPSTLTQQLCKELFENEISKPFNLATDLMVRVQIIKLASEEHYCCITLHHIALDGWSLNLFFEELEQAYQSFNCDREPSFTPLKLQYANFADWQQARISNGDFAEELGYWQSHLNDAPQCHQLPLDYTRPKQWQPTGSIVRTQLGAELTAKLKQFAKMQKVTMFTALQQAYALTMSMFSGQTDILMGTPIAGRERKETHDLLGCFTNTLVLRSQFDNHASFTNHVTQSHKHWLNNIANQSVPFEQLMSHLNPQRVQGAHPLFQLWFVLNTQATPGSNFSLADTHIVQDEANTRLVKFDLMLAASESGDELHLEWQFNRSLFKAETIQAFARLMESILAQALASPHLAISELEIAQKQNLSVVEAQPLTTPQYLENVCQAFQHWLMHEPNRVAVVDGTRSLTYQALAQRVDRLAGLMADMGVEQGSYVALKFERGLEAIVSMLATLKLGAAYLPLDLALPAERIEFVINDAQPALILTTSQYLHDFDNCAVDSCLIEAVDEPDWLADIEPILDAPVINPHDPVYVIYTSGTTGQPKGVVVTHANLSHYLSGLICQYQFESKLSYAVMSSIATDLGNTTLFLSLASAGTMHLLGEQAVLSSDLVCQYFDKYGIDVAKLTPSHFSALSSSEHHPIAQHTMIFGGEKLPASTAALVKNDHPQIRVINHYGPTEACIGCLTHEVQSLADNVVMPLGLPLPGTSVYVVNEQLKAVVKGAWGELIICGPAIAQGYLNQSQLTAERFIEWTDENGLLVRGYRSGDRVRINTLGLIEFAGRNDDQVKIRGFRVETQEITEVAKAICHASNATTFILGEAGQEQLYCVIECTAGEASLSVQQVRQEMANILPAHMLPSVISFVACMPLLANGKLDIKAIKILAQGESDEQLVAATTVQQQLVHDLWCDLLNNDRISIDKGFFEVGGNSLLATRLSNEIKILTGVKVPLRTLMDNPTITDLAWLLEDTKKDNQSIDNNEEKIEFEI
ncbi:Dimodular nonribosomal peptide synthase [Pseudoalteromonas holothuriae]|uniref:Dimodular nonribosomal peptide synthase n=1 Tax=Pseudoalteromonas holothuriae TaxID=2963714 RepID=A0ABN8UNM9_9GAMM|nr:non-ribosomal peptide synthetase [Pseudoalteromonas sp. CIP111951]CAH9063353.1 Dimodular nonribosomal peptide synthase [Pseudoalteromonas sp. CIP111951]